MGRLETSHGNLPRNGEGLFTSPMGRLETDVGLGVGMGATLFTSPMGRLETLSNQQNYYISHHVYIPDG